MKIPDSPLPRVVIIGGGFAGLEVAKTLQNKPFQVVILDKNNHFTFQPLLYQVATGGLEPNSIAYPLQRIFQNTSDVLFRMAEVKRIVPESGSLETSIGPLDYDYLVIATGSQPNFFGLPPAHLLPLKTVPQALQMRNHILKSFEKAIIAESQAERNARTNFVVVGGGPTGVELAGALGEMKKFVLPKDYPSLDFSLMKVYLVEGLGRLLPAMSEKASADACKHLENLGVEVHLNTMVDEYDGKKVQAGEKSISTANLIWTAGVEPSTPEGMIKAGQKKGRLKVNAFNQVGPYSNIFAVGDVAAMESEKYPEGHPMLAPVAQQQGRRLGKNLQLQEKGKAMKPFEYLDKGTMATVGRNRAVADIGKLHLKGFPAWLAWMFIHLLMLIGFRNKLVVMVNWIYNYFTYDKALRLIIKRGDNEEEAFKEKEAASFC